MRYIRFLKCPRVVVAKRSAQHEAQCLITITSDLGDSFLPHDVELAAELLACGQQEQSIVWRTVQWTAGMRSLAVTLPVPRSRLSSTLRVRVGSRHGATSDTYEALLNTDSRGVVSVWSAEFTTTSMSTKHVERRFLLAGCDRLSIWEEAGESIARHIWDAGVSLACNLEALLDVAGFPIIESLPSQPGTRIRIIELGSGCGIVGISLAQRLRNVEVVLTDLSETRDIVIRNIESAIVAKDSSVQFHELEWGADLPICLQAPSPSFTLLVAADCTYNPDSSKALVKTFQRLAHVFPDVVIAIAMKFRHASEQVFFKNMNASGFEERVAYTQRLPSDYDSTNWDKLCVFLYTYRT
ncbi:hypothetical protein ACN47E_002353 [Coniothyrium glycines]